MISRTRRQAEQLRVRRNLAPVSEDPPAGRRGAMKLSLFFFSSDEALLAGDKYRLVREAAKFADAHGFAAIWTPERHFHPFGGIYPSPATLSAALAAWTERIGIRAGSVVLPLHNPIRVAEEWSVIDNISGGRAGVSFASGWSPRDFVFAPDGWEKRNDLLFDGVDEVRRLWRGEPARYRAGADEIELVTRPRPVQPELPVWITSGREQSTCQRAGAIGANLLTALIRQTPDRVVENIAAYRAARTGHGHDPATGQVTLMMHTLLGSSADQVRKAVTSALSAYLSTFLDLVRDLAVRLDPEMDVERLSQAEREALVEHAMDRYTTTNGLFGTPESALKTAERFHADGIDEIACLLDFGLPDEVVLDGLRHLAELRRMLSERRGEASE